VIKLKNTHEIEIIRPKSNNITSGFSIFVLQVSISFPLKHVIFVFLLKISWSTQLVLLIRRLINIEVGEWARTSAGTKERTVRTLQKVEL